MERAKGFETSHESQQAVDGQSSHAFMRVAGSRIGSHLSVLDRRELARVVASWSKLHPAVKSAIVAMVSSTNG
jgi:hypothetical protein